MRRAALPDRHPGRRCLLPDGLALAVGAEPAWQVAWRTCAATGCEARLALSPPLLAALRRERAGTVRFALADGTQVRLPVSLLGLSAARRALLSRP
jgi:invasion protein IalB